MIEVWKPIKGYEGLYDVSNYGRVRKGTTVLKPTKDKLTGYMKINLRKDNTVKYKTVHRLVAEAFLQNDDALPCVNHKDECKTNNMVDNLEWCTYKYNSNYKANK